MPVGFLFAYIREVQGIEGCNYPMKSDYCKQSFRFAKEKQFNFLANYLKMDVKKGRGML